jgi:hypothetical protein
VAVVVAAVAEAAAVRRALLALLVVAEAHLLVQVPAAAAAAAAEGKSHRFQSCEYSTPTNSVMQSWIVEFHNRWTNDNWLRPTAAIRRK